MGAIGGSGVSIEPAVPLDGSSGMTGPLQLSDGSAAAPGLTFANDTNTGFARLTDDEIAFVANGQIRAELNLDGFLIARNKDLGWSPTFAGVTGLSAADLILARDDANTLAQRNTTNAQTLNLYNTFTDASNFERLAINAASAADVQIVPEAAGTGTLRGLQLSSASGRLGFYGTTAIAKPAVTGSRAGNAALADLLTELANLGILTDSSTA